MDYVRYKHSFQAEGIRLAEAAARDMNAVVPTCPGWVVGDVVRHTGAMYLTAVTRLRPGQPPDPPEQPAPARGRESGKDLLDRYLRAHATLREELTRRESAATPEPGRADDPDHLDAPAFQGLTDDERDTAFWFRRMALEAAVHRADVELAVDRPAPIDPDLALAGIDEALRVLLPLKFDGRRPDAVIGRTVGVHTKQHHWRVTLGAGGVTVSRTPGFADAAVTGEPAEILLYLWGRRPGTVVSRTGDREILAAFRHRLALAMT
jgi:uncharacterized protein (TIGR03083 family)